MRLGRLGLLAGAAALWVGVCLCCPRALAQSPAESSPTTAPSGELLQTKAVMPGYGVEAYRLVSNKDQIISVLRNGAVVICTRVPSPVATVVGYVKTGGVYEGKWLGGGLSHLLEHLVAGGSNARHTEAQSRAMLAKLGNNSNAFTSRDCTEFFINTTNDHFDQAADVVTSWLLGALITQPEYRREYQVVQRELERNKANPDMVFYLLCDANRYEVSPAHVPVIGYQEVIQGLKRDDVYEYYKMAYVPNNLVFSVAADIDPEKMLATMRQDLSDTPPGRAFSHDIADEPPVLGPRTAVATFPKLGQARVSLAFPSVRLSDDDMYALDLLSRVLGGGESSILVEEVRDRLGLCSDIGCGDDTPAFVGGSFQVVMQLEPANIAAATDAILKQIDKVKADGVSPDRLERAKTAMKIDRLRAMQTSQQVAQTMAEDFAMTGDAHFSDLYVQRIGQVTPEQIKAVARKYLNRRALVTTVLLPREAVGAQGLPKAEDLIRSASALSGGIAAAGSTDFQASQAPITRTVLDNGLVVLHRQISTTPLVEIRMYALGGVTAEDASTNGIGNLAMSMIRRGTATRSATQIADFFEQTGGDLQTACGNNTWFWNSTCTHENLDATAQVLADIVEHPAFDARELEGIRSRTLAAIQGEDASWDSQASHFFKRQFFGPLNSPYQFTTLGSKANVTKFTPADLAHWYQTKVLPAPRVLAIFGDVDQKTALDLARKYFSSDKVASVVQSPQNPQPPSQAAKTPTVDVDRVEVLKTDQDMAGIFIGFDSASQLGQPDESALVVSECLTGGYFYPSGYIFKILRDKGWVYEAGSYNSPGCSDKFTGAFVGYAGCDPRNVNKVVDVILQSMARLQGSEQDVQMDWFNNCKTLITTAQAMETETPGAQAEQAATDELFGLGYNFHAGFADRINAVTRDDVLRVANSRLRHCVVTVCTPDPDGVKIDKGPHEFASFAYVDLTPRGIQHDVGAK